MVGPTYFVKPVVKTTFDSTSYENDKLLSADIPKQENAAGLIATLLLNDVDLVPSVVTADTVVKVEIKEDGGSYPANPLFSGVVQTPRVISTPEGEKLELSCLDNGLGIGRMTVAEEYGTQSRNSTIYTIDDIIDDIISNQINKIFGGSASGYTYTTDLETIADEIPYILWGYKPGLFCLQDLMDVITAFHAGTTAGPSFITTTDNVLHMKTVGADSTDWHTYYGNSTSTATLTYGVDYLRRDFALTGRGPNYIIQYGGWRRPSNGDAWTETDCDTLWTAQTVATQLSEDTTNHIVDEKSLKALVTAIGGANAGCRIEPPTGAWDFSIFTDFNTPTMNFYIRRHGAINNLYVAVQNYSGGVVADGVKLLDSDIASDDKWYHFSFPIGSYYNTGEKFTDFKWYGSGALDWSAINRIVFYWNAPQDSYLNIDGFHFGGADLCRVAYNSNATIFYQNIIIDDQAYDDSLVASDDSGIMAKLTLANLLREQKVSTSGTLTTPLIADVLPGQFFKINTADYRATKMVHHLKPDSGVFNTEFTFTNDLYNGRVKPRYDTQEAQLQQVRPEWQDRQAANMKTAGKVDIRVARLVKSYAL